MALRPNRLILVKLILAVFLFSFVWLILPIFVFISILFRSIIKILAKLFRSDLGPILNGMGASIALDDLEKPKYNLVMYFVLDGTVSVERFRRIFEKTILPKRHPNGDLFYPELQQTVCTFLGYIFRKWETAFEVRKHIREYDYQEDLPMGSPCESEDLRRNLGGLMSRGWKNNFSPWEFIVISNFCGSKTELVRTCFIARVHHVLGDGYSIINWIMRDYAQTDFKTQLPKRPKMSLWMKIPRNLLFPVVGTWELADNLVDSFDTENCWHSWGKLSKEYHTSISEPIDLQLVKDIKNKYGVSFATVLYTALCGGMRRVMEDAGQVVPKSFASFNPMPLANHPPGLVNYISMMYIRWPLSIKSPIIRMKLIQRNLQRIVGSSVPSTMFWLTQANGMFPTWGQRLFHARNYCTAITSVYPTPPEVPYFSGCEVLESAIAIPLGPGQQGLSVIMMGIGGKLRVVANLEKNVSPSEKIFQNLGAYVTQELMWLHEQGASNYSDRENNVEMIV